MMTLDCSYNNLVNKNASQILNLFIKKSNDFTLLRQVSFENNLLTQIPPEIRIFPKLTQLNFAFNLINSIGAADFNFKALNISDDETVQLLINNNKISNIEPGALDGNVIIQIQQNIV